MEAPNIWGSLAWNMPHVNFLAPKNFEVTPTFLVNLEIQYTQVYGVAWVATIKYMNKMAHLESVS
jgi:hypothetical protein